MPVRAGREWRDEGWNWIGRATACGRQDCACRACRSCSQYTPPAMTRSGECGREARRSRRCRTARRTTGDHARLRRRPRAKPGSLPVTEADGLTAPGSPTMGWLCDVWVIAARRADQPIRNGGNGRPQRCSVLVVTAFVLGWRPATHTRRLWPLCAVGRSPRPSGRVREPCPCRPFKHCDGCAPCARLTRM